MTAPPLLTPEQLADRLGVSVNTVYAWNYRGTGPKRVRVGRHVRYQEQDIAAWLAEHIVQEELAVERQVGR